MSRWTLIRRLVLLLMVVVALPGCAGSNTASDDSTPDLAPVPSHEDDSHGWGASVGSGR